MQADDKLLSFMKDVVRYERTIGELLDRNDILSAEVERHRQEREVWFGNRQESIGSELASLTNMMLRLTEQQGRQFDMVFRLLAAAFQTPAGDGKLEGGALQSALDRSTALSETMHRIITGREAERTKQLKVNLIEDRSIRALRGSLAYDSALDPSGKIVLVLEENSETGVHSIIIPVSEVSATGFRGVILEALPLGVKILRVRVRQSNDWQNYAEVNIDLKAMQHANFQTSFSIGRREVVISPMLNSWVRILVESSLELGDAPVEVELIAMESIKSGSSKRKGHKSPAFAVKSCRILRSDGLTSVEADRNVHSDLNDPRRTSPSLSRVEISTPPQERARREKRDAYLASGAYRKLAQFRNKHAGKRAFIIGNGPSINNQDLTLLKNEITFVTNWFINHPKYTKINPTYFCVSSHEMFGGWGADKPHVNKDWLEPMLAKAGSTHKFFSYPFRDFLIGDGYFSEEKSDFLLFDRPKYQVDQRDDINLDLSQFMDDGYTGIVTFCLPLAHFMGIKEIYLVGCDCDYGLTTPEAPKSYFYDFSKHTTKTTSHEGLMRVWADNGPIFKTYEIVRKRFLQDGIQIVNCTAGGRLEVFPRASFEDVVGSRR